MYNPLCLTIGCPPQPAVRLFLRHGFLEQLFSSGRQAAGLGVWWSINNKSIFF
jgi:hypothetical protein